MGIRVNNIPVFQRPSGKLYLAVNQLNLLGGALNLVLLDTISTNFNDAIENTVTHRITPGEQGFYSIKGQVTFNNCIVDTSYVAVIYLTGMTTINYVKQHCSIVNANLTVPIFLDAFLGVDDYIDLRAISNSGDDTVDIDSGENATFLSIQRTR